MMTVCTFNARTLASEASIEDLMMQARKIRRTSEGLHIGIHDLQWKEQGEMLSGFIMTTKTIHEERKPKFKKWSPNSLAGSWKDAVVDNIAEEYDRLCQHLERQRKESQGFESHQEGPVL
ncbi:hypothetical protein ANCCAN_11307 [Ancylostoma caninum]|uniref:Uncharacterized protein n=1 Tax=Ancylostoma caninum TaxID=29170 RepID=A0A368GGC3_ANCCA|nr:hypothetical protein ANCCAN_11307 [Ancylostoma caninum]